MAARNRLPPWHEMVRTADGRDLLIRPIRPADAVPLRAGFPLLEPDALHDRLLRCEGGITAESADRLTHPDPRREFRILRTRLETSSRPLPALMRLLRR